MNAASPKFFARRARLQEMTIAEVHELLAGNGRDSLELQLRIIKQVGASAVALFAIRSMSGTDQLNFAGSGTLITDGTRYWILTAAHVWKKLPIGTSKLAITLTPGLDHCFPIEISALEVKTFSPQVDWSEAGPDLALIQIPTEIARRIEAYKTFYYWQPDPAQLAIGESLECFYLLGTPGDLGSFSSTHANVEIRGFLVWVTKQQELKGFDLVDVDAHLPQDTSMGGFGGVSGGGLWRVRIFIESTASQPDWKWRLEGTAFFQFPAQGTSAIIRCHGPNSIRQAIADVTKA